MPVDTVVVLDFETTGLHPDRGDRITEVAALRLRQGKIVDRYHSLMNCDCRLTHSIRSFTGINQHMVNSAPQPSRVVPELLLFIGYDPVVSHNAAFDQGFLDCECERLHLQRYGEDFVCTVQLARRLLPQLPCYSLHGLMRHFNLSHDNQHRAAVDAEATAQVLLKLCELATHHVSKAQLDITTLRLLSAPPLPDWQQDNAHTATMNSVRGA